MFTYTLIYGKIRLIEGDKMNNKGFTLIELLAVIVILVGISLTAVMGISASLEKRDEKECREQIEIAKNSAKIYFSLNNTNKVSIGTLKNNDYFDGNKVSKLKDEDTIIISDGGYTFNGKSINEAICSE